MPPRGGIGCAEVNKFNKSGKRVPAGGDHARPQPQQSVSPAGPSPGLRPPSPVPTGEGDGPLPCLSGRQAQEKGNHRPTQCSPMSPVIGHSQTQDKATPSRSHFKRVGEAKHSPIRGEIPVALDLQSALGARPPVRCALEPDRRPSWQAHAPSRSQTQPSPKALAGRAGAPPTTGAYRWPFHVSPFTSFLRDTTLSELLKGRAVGPA